MKLYSIVHGCIFNKYRNKMKNHLINMTNISIYRKYSTLFYF
ncbi:hypothetical protein PROVRETT_08909 [Providencia rettgeri DSM 1131]|nr:hypothetical protein PROVRETT_08909 [Providencia rettgeri DSM 1131]